ncbi:MAG: GTP cyclohydrolase I FolE [Thermomicrobiales bacterium]
MDLERIEAAVREILTAMGEDPDREGLRDTPDRVARMYAEVFASVNKNIDDEDLKVTFSQEQREMVVLRDIPFASFCEHHLLPFTGVAHVGYIPNGQVIGLSKLARLVEFHARRPQIQERMTSEIADSLMGLIDPDGVAVVVEATHTCMTVRGVQKLGATMVTSAMQGRIPQAPGDQSRVLRRGRLQR